MILTPTYLKLSYRHAWYAALVLAAFWSANCPLASAQNEKRTVFSEDNFHWQGNLKPGQTLEIINRNGEIEASGASGEGARVEGMRRDDGDDKELFIEVVESSEGVIICAVYSRDKTPGRCHHGGVRSDSSNWHGHRAKLTFNVQVPPGARFSAMTTNGGGRCRAPHNGGYATTTHGNIDGPTSERGPDRATNAGVKGAQG